MKRKVIVSLVVAGVIGWGGAALAFGKFWAQPKTPKTELRQREALPTPESQQHQQALDTGHLPASHSKVDAAKTGTSRDAGRVIFLRGIPHRVGVDIP